jgi:hypothetical protein
MQRYTAVCLSLTFFLIQPFGLAQNADTAPQDARNQVTQTFERTAPALGGPLPSLSLFDGKGNQLNLDQLRGHYTVLVFGCLT